MIGHCFVTGNHRPIVLFAPALSLVAEAEREQNVNASVSQLI
jgi:hypothetical protein